MLRFVLQRFTAHCALVSDGTVVEASIVLPESTNSRPVDAGNPDMKVKEQSKFE